VTEVHSLCDVLGEDFIAIVNEVHPGLHETSDPGKPTSISDSTLATLAQVVATLAAEKAKRATMVRRACFFLYIHTYARMHARHNLWLIPSTCSALLCIAAARGRGALGGAVGADGLVGGGAAEFQERGGRSEP
jgi:hypothetical protein